MLLLLLLLLLSIIELSHMNYHLLFTHLLKIVSHVILNSRKLEKTLNKQVVVGILCKANTSIIEVILPNWM